MTQPTTPNTQETPRMMLRTNRILVAAMMMGLVFFSAVMIVVNLGNEPVLDDKTAPIFFYAAIGIGFVCIIAAFSIYNNKVAAIQGSSAPLGERLAQYRTILIMYMALCEASGLFAVIVLFLTGNFYVLVVTLIAILAMYRKMPYERIVIRDLKLDWEDQQDLI